MLVGSVADVSRRRPRTHAAGPEGFAGRDPLTGSADVTWLPRTPPVVMENRRRRRTSRRCSSSSSRSSRQHPTCMSRRLFRIRLRKGTRNRKARICRRAVTVNGKAVKVTRADRLRSRVNLVPAEGPLRGADHRQALERQDRAGDAAVPDLHEGRSRTSSLRCGGGSRMHEQVFPPRVRRLVRIGTSGRKKGRAMTSPGCRALRIGRCLSSRCCPADSGVRVRRRLAPTVRTICRTAPRGRRSRRWARSRASA